MGYKGVMSRDGAMKWGITCIFSYTISVFKVFCVFMIALFVPRLCVYHIKHTERAECQPILGIEACDDRLLSSIVSHGTVCEQRVALVTDVHTCRASGADHIELLRAKGVCVTTAFILDADDHSMQLMPNDISIIPISSDQSTTLANYPVTDFECIVIDIQETGFTLYDGNPLLSCLRIARAANKSVIVFDRPNMLGAAIEGFGVWLGSRASVPFRHGMTIGEFAQFCNKHVLDTPVDLHVIPMKQYQRLSRTNEHVRYVSDVSIRGFIDIMHEVHPFETRTSLDKAYHCVMLPLDSNISKRMWYEVRAQLKRAGIESKLYEYSNEATGRSYIGLNCAVHDVHSFSLSNAVLIMLRFFSDAGLTMTYSETLRDMIGMHAVQSYLAGTVTDQEVRAALKHEAQLFYNKAIGSFLYQPLPKVMIL